MAGIADMIRTIAMLQQLRQAQEAMVLDRERLALQQQQAGAGVFSDFARLLPGLADPNALQPQIPELAERTGFSPELLQNFITQTPAATSTTTSRAVQRGAQQAGGALDPTAFSVAATGARPGQLASDAFTAELFGGARGYVNELEPEKRQQFIQRFTERQASGMSPSEAAFDAARLNFSPEETAQAARIGAQLVPGASADAQIRLGWANLRQQQMAFEQQSALEDMKLRAALEGNQQQLSAQAVKEANDLLARRAEFLTQAARQSATLTPSGVESFAAQINAMNAQLRLLAPSVFGKGAPNELRDMPTGKTISARNVFEYFGTSIGAR